MNTSFTIGAGRKKTSTALALTTAALIALLPACAGRKEFQKGYERGAADTVKRQYWIQQNLQKRESAPELRPTLYRVPVTPDPAATVQTVPYEITIPIYE